MHFASRARPPPVLQQVVWPPLPPVLRRFASPGPPPFLWQRIRLQHSAAAFSLATHTDSARSAAAFSSAILFASAAAFFIRQTLRLSSLRSGFLFGNAPRLSFGTFAGDPFRFFRRRLFICNPLCFCFSGSLLFGKSLRLCFGSTSSEIRLGSLTLAGGISLSASAAALSSSMPLLPLLPLPPSLQRSTALPPRQPLVLRQVVSSTSAAASSASRFSSAACSSAMRSASALSAAAFSSASRFASALAAAAFSFASFACAALSSAAFFLAAFASAALAFASASHRPWSCEPSSFSPSPKPPQPLPLPSAADPSRRNQPAAFPPPDASAHPFLQLASLRPAFPKLPAHRRPSFPPLPSAARSPPPARPSLQPQPFH